MDTIREYLNYELKDNENETGGISFEGETLKDFLQELLSGPDDYKQYLDTKLDVMNVVLDEYGIAPIEK